MSRGKWHEVVICGHTNADACRHLLQHYERGELQEDLCFGYWTPSTGLERETAIVTDIALPGQGDRDLHGNASFNGTYLARATREAIRRRCGLVFMHSHPSNGWQGMSSPDVQAERDRIAYTARATRRPLVGMTVGMDGHWSARIWNDSRRGATRYWSRKVRVVDRGRLVVWQRPQERRRRNRKQRRTVESWGEDKQRIIEGIRVGIVGLGSVGSIVAEGLARVGMRELVLIDDDSVEERNLDRLLNASVKDIGRAKTDVAEEAVRRASTADRIETINIRKKIQHEHAYAAARDCDILVCCVDSPVARDVVNRISYRDGIPVVDGGVEILRMYNYESANDPEEGSIKPPEWTRLEKKAKNLLHEYDPEGSEERGRGGSTYGCSCSTNGPGVEDDLMFWRLYGNNGEGCSLKLGSVPRGMYRVRYRDQGRRLTREVAEDREVAGRMERLLAIRRETIGRMPESGRLLTGRSIARVLGQVLDGYSHLVKNRAYEHEREWRMISVMPDRDKVRYDVGSDRVVRRYVDGGEMAKLFSSSSVITIGPGVPNSGAARDYIEAMARKGGMKYTRISVSSKRYR